MEAAGSDTDILMLNGILGESVTFPLNIQESQEVTSIAWNSKTSVAFVVPGNSGAEPTVSITHQNYHERINVSGQNYNLELRNLRMEDSGIYKADINTKTPEKFTTTTRCYNLQVYRRLGKPKITQSLMTSVNNTCNVTLTCSMEKEEKNVTYSWSPLGEVGNVVQIFQTSDNQKLTYTCTAWNPVSNNSNSISAQQLCTGSYLKIFSKNPGNTVSQTSSSPLIVNRALGESVTFPLKFSAEENVTSITWLHNGISITFIQLNEKQSPLKYVTDPQRKNRLTVTDSYSLQLSNLTMADAGFYKAQKTTVSSSVLSTYDLRIFILNISLSDLLAFCIKVSLSSFEPASDARRANIVTDFGEIWFPKEGRLRNLQVVTHIERPSNVTCEIHLTCSVENPNDVIFRWQISGKTLLREANLTISWDPKNDSEETYTCIAENPVSNSSFSVPVQSLCKGSPFTPCKPPFTMSYKLLKDLKRIQE
ncbi:hypothetical protein CB1_000141009 [Camelus ferus]|nr:hypothetical protein CB1_000141009 [Camelus ferus]